MAKRVGAVKEVCPACTRRGALLAGQRGTHKASGLCQLCVAHSAYTDLSSS